MFTTVLTIPEKSAFIRVWPVNERMVKMTVNQIRDYTRLVMKYLDIVNTPNDQWTPELRAEKKAVYDQCMAMRQEMQLVSSC